MIGRTLGGYLAWQFLRNALGVFALFFFLIVVVDIIEFSRRVGNIPGVGFGEVSLVVLTRAPSFAEGVLPFAVLFGASASLIVLNRRLELVVARASGLSVWQFLLPLAATAALVGLCVSLAYGPIARSGKVISTATEAQIFSRGKKGSDAGSSGFWMRLNQPDGDVVLRAEVEENAGTKLTKVTAFRFNSKGLIAERLEANSAVFVESQRNGNHFRLVDVIVSVQGSAQQQRETVVLPVNISRSELQSTRTNVEDLSFWGLIQEAKRAQQSGKNSLPYWTRFQSLLSAPLLFIAMVLVAATVSLRFARFGINAKAILTGVLAGFVLYVSSKLLVTFGSNGLVPPFYAAWSPALVASLIGITVLLHQEDG